MLFTQIIGSAALLSFALLLQSSAKPAPPAQRASRASGQSAQPANNAAQSGKVRAAGIWYGVESAPKKHAGALRIAAYNVENLFDPMDDPTQSGEYDDIDEVTKPVRLKALAKAIHELDADVLCMEEVESKAALEWFRDEYLSDMGYEFVASEDVGYYRGVEQSVLSRVPIEKVTIWSAERIDDMLAAQTPELATRLKGNWAMPEKGAKPTTHFQRSPLMVDLKTKDGYAFTVISVHYKAGAFDHQRELEALQTEAFVKARLDADPKINLVVLGDFNGTPNDMNVKVLRTSALGLRSGYDFRAQKDAPKELYTTHASNRSIDFMIMTPGMAEDVVDGSYFVLGTLHAASDWDYKKAAEIPPPDGYASDHYPLAIEILPTNEGEHHVLPATPSQEATPAMRQEAPSKSTNTTSEPSADGAPPKPIGDAASASDVALADALKTAGWHYEMPQPKSKTAKWGNFNKGTTWFPGYWLNATTNKTSATQPTASDNFKGDGLPKPAWVKGGSPSEPSWVEFLCTGS